MLLANTTLLRTVNVHQDPDVMGKWHEHGLFSVGVIYGFPLTCVQVRHPPPPPCKRGIDPARARRGSGTQMAGWRRTAPPPSASKSLHSL